MIIFDEAYLWLIIYGFVLLRLFLMLNLFAFTLLFVALLSTIYMVVSRLSSDRFQSNFAKFAKRFVL